MVVGGGEEEDFCSSLLPYGRVGLNFEGWSVYVKRALAAFRVVQLVIPFLQRHETSEYCSYTTYVMCGFVSYCK
jgi:hypothetical protein